MGIVATTVGAVKSAINTAEKIGNVVNTVKSYNKNKKGIDSVYKKNNLAPKQPKQPAAPKNLLNKKKPSQFNPGNKGAFAKGASATNKQKKMEVKKKLMDMGFAPHNKEKIYGKLMQ